MKHVLVTGGAGYIGSHTVVELINSGYEPIIIDDFSNASQDTFSSLEELCNRKLNLHVGSCTDSTFLNNVFSLYNFEGVIHFAAHKAVGESVEFPEKYYQNNLVGLLNILTRMEDFGVKKLVFSSSCTVYGIPQGTSSVYENTALGTPNSPYGWTKWMGEQIIRDTVNKGKLQAIFLRYFNPIGAHPSGLIGEFPVGVPNNIVPFITQTAAGLREKLLVFGNDYPTKDGTGIRDYIHVSDVASAHIAALTCPLESNPEVFNVGTGEGTSVLQLISAFTENTGVQLNWSFAPRRAGDVPEIYANTDKAKKQLNWSSKFTVKDALIDAWRWEQNRLKS